jgi:hypothetical protein
LKMCGASAPSPAASLYWQIHFAIPPYVPSQIPL